MSFEAMKKNSKNSDALIEKLSALDDTKKNSYKDDRFWRPQVDDAGTGTATIRFLPEAPGEDTPFVLYYSHGFQGPGGWYIENSRTTLGEKDPVSEMNTRLWNSGDQAKKDLVSQRYKRKKSYISNVLVVDDPANPENNGKVFLYRYGTKIYQKIQDAMRPEFSDEEAIVPFDFWKGANFRLRIRKVAGFLNYDKSGFDSMSELFDGDDDRLKKLWESEYKLNEFIDPSNYKSYDELKSRLDMVLGGSAPKETAENTSLESEESFGRDETTTPTVQDSAPSEEDDAMSYFERLASED
tara:strand:- start:41 stop:931 length:891 start_codon:yes stop_codon:yes gene_type:complete